MGSEYRPHGNSKNIKRRVKILRYIFNIEDSISHRLDVVFVKNTLTTDDIENSFDGGRESLFKALKRDSNFNKSLSKTFSDKEFHLSKFLEHATFTNLINIISITKKKIKFDILNLNIPFKTYKRNMTLLIKLRNKVSHSSLMNVDDLISKLLPLPGSNPQDPNKQLQYETLVLNLLKSFNLGFSKVDFNV